MTPNNATPRHTANRPAPAGLFRSPKIQPWHLDRLAIDHVGLILGLEMSRLARSCKDWHHLIELCAIFRVLLADQDGLYDPTDHNDRLLLGLTGIMSEAELHLLRSRMRQGLLNKVRRGEVFM